MYGSVLFKPLVNRDTRIRLVERDILASDRDIPQGDRPPATADISADGISGGLVGYPLSSIDQSDTG